MSIDSSSELVALTAPISKTPQPQMLPAGAYRANLYVYDPFGRIDWYALVPQSFVGGRYFTLGRGSDCDIKLNDGSVSTRHAYIAGGVGELVLTDLQSTNGTTVNGQRVGEAVLRHGDVIRVGATDIRFLYSYKNSPVHLVLDFVAGINAGRSVATYGSSTNIGRLNCAINLPGQNVAAQHVRVDAFGHELLFVVNLHKNNETWLNGAPLQGIATARQGDVLQIGDHQVVLRVVEDDALADAIPQGDGTLLLGTGVDGAAPVAQVGAADLARLEAHLQDLPALASAVEDTAADGEPRMTEHIESPTSPSDRSHAPVPRPDGEGAWGPPPPAPAPPRAPTPPAAAGLEKLAEAPPPQRRRRRRLMRWLMLPAFVGGLALGAALVPVPRTLTLQGTLEAAQESALHPPARGRIEHLYFRPGDTVVDGDVIAQILDLGVQADFDRLSARVADLQARTEERVRVVPIGPSASTLRALHAAESEQRAAATAVAALTEAFNRREVAFDLLEEARSKERALRAKVDDLRQQVAAERNRTRIEREGPPDAVIDELAEAVAQREALERKLRVQLVAKAPGILVEAGPEAPRTGMTVQPADPLFRVVDGRRLLLRLRVPGAHLGALDEAETGRLEPEGQPERARDIALARPGAAAGPDGAFPLVTELDNADAMLRPGQKVRVTVELPDISALRWLVQKVTD